MIKNIKKWFLIYYYEKFNWISIKNDHSKTLIVSMVILITFPIIKKILGIFELEQIIPFRIWVLYIGSVSYFLSLTVYRFFCPSLIKNFKSFTDFYQKEENPKKILKDIMNNDCLFNDMNEGKILNAKERNKLAYWMIFLNKYADCSFTDTAIENPEIEYLQNCGNEIGDGNLGEAFVELRQRLSVSILPVVILSKSLFILSLILAFFTSAQVIYQVFIPWSF